MIESIAIQTTFIGSYSLAVFLDNLHKIHTTTALDIERYITIQLHTISKETLQGCLDQWKTRWNKFVKCQGESLKKINVWNNHMVSSNNSCSFMIVCLYSLSYSFKYSNLRFIIWIFIWFHVTDFFFSCNCTLFNF